MTRPEYLFSYLARRGHMVTGTSRQVGHRIICVWYVVLTLLQADVLTLRNVDRLSMQAHARVDRMSRCVFHEVIITRKSVVASLVMAAS